MSFKNIPDQEDVTETSVGKLIKITDENRQGLLKYIGEKCKYCGHIYNGVDDIMQRDVVRFSNDGFKIACYQCWDDAQ